MSDADAMIRIACAYAQVIRDWADRMLDSPSSPGKEGRIVEVFDDDLSYVASRAARIAEMLSEIHPAGDSLLFPDTKNAGDRNENQN